MFTEETQRQLTTPHREGLEDSHLESAHLSQALGLPEWLHLWFGMQEGLRRETGMARRSKDGKIFNYNVKVVFFV